MSGPLTFAFVDSWHGDPRAGSGTTVAIRGLRGGLEALGHRVVRAGATDGSWRGGSLLGRLAYNVRVAADPPHQADVVVGFDVDGFLLAGRNGASGPAAEDAPPFVLSLKGVAADEARWERGPVRLRHRVLAAVERASARRAGRVVVPSAYSARRAVEEYGVPPSRVVVVPEGIEVDAYADGVRERREPHGPGGRPPTVLSVARQYPRKNTADLLEALPRVAAAVPDVRLRIVGDGPCLPSLRRRARGLGVEERVEFTGSLPRERVREAYREADCFCLPSLQEGFGLVFLEAMASGLPVVAARAGAVPEVVRHGEDGVLVGPGRIRDLAEALVAVLDDPPLARRMGAAGRARARRFDWTRTAAAFVEAVRPLVGEPPAERRGDAGRRPSAAASEAAASRATTSRPAPEPCGAGGAS